MTTWSHTSTPTSS